MSKNGLFGMSQWLSLLKISRTTVSAQSSGVLDQRVYSDSSLDLGHPLPVPVWRLSPH